MEKKYLQYKDYRTSILDILFPTKNQLKPQMGFDESNQWTKYELNEIASIPSKEKVKSTDGKQLLTVKLHCKGIEVNEDIIPKITKSGRPYFERLENEILIGRQNIHNGDIGIVNSKLNGGICSNAITSLKINESNSTDFVYYYLSRFTYYKRIERFMHGTGQKELSEKELMKLKINLPDYQEQKRISSFIKTVDSNIHNLNKEIILTKEFKKSLLNKMFC